MNNPKKVTLLLAAVSIALTLLFLPSLGAQERVTQQAGDPAAVLRRVAAAYEKLRSFEITASLSLKVPGQDVTVTTGQSAYYASPAMLPADAPIPLLETTILDGRPVFRNSAGQGVKPTVKGFTLSGFPFLSLNVVDTRVISARALPDETLVVGGESIPCTVIEAVHNKRSEFGRGRPIRLWIEKKTWLVRQARYEAEWSDGELAQWTACVEKMTLNQLLPQYLIDHMEFMKGHEDTKWAGQAAPDFIMKALDGQSVTLAGLRGKVVVLDFWATWCSPCREEMPLLEKLRDELKPQGVEIWGVTDEKPDVARRWLADRKRTLPTLIDTDRALFRHYAIEKIPVLIVLRRDGRISSLVVGLLGERDVRADIAKAME
jgi:peroxiredoxin